MSILLLRATSAQRSVARLCLVATFEQRSARYARNVVMSTDQVSPSTPIMVNAMLRVAESTPHVPTPVRTLATLTLAVNHARNLARLPAVTLDAQESVQSHASHAQSRNAHLSVHTQSARFHVLHLATICHAVCDVPKLLVVAICAHQSAEKSVRQPNSARFARMMRS
jgi:hypothetical protein